MTTPRRIVLATANPGKVRELRKLLPPWIEVVTAHDLGVSLPPETGTTFRENALIKARAVSQATGLIALADDSGLEIDALGGRPGVHSAHYAGERATDAHNIARVLNELKEVPPERRTARFRAVVALVAPDGREAVTEGVIEGTITTEPRGRGGFGYDPIFVPLGERRTFAEMTEDEKNQLSHRAQALRGALPILLQWLDRPTPSEARER